MSDEPWRFRRASDPPIDWAAELFASPPPELSPAEATAVADELAGRLEAGCTAHYTGPPHGEVPPGGVWTSPYQIEDYEKKELLRAPNHSQPPHGYATTEYRFELVISAARASDAMAIAFDRCDPPETWGAFAVCRPA
jgi:hypothetical protein